MMKFPVALVDRIIAQIVPCKYSFLVAVALRRIHVRDKCIPLLPSCLDVLDWWKASGDILPSAESGDTLVHMVLMPEYHCWPIWIMKNDGLENVDPSKFIDDKDLFERLMSWDRAYESTYDTNDMAAPLDPATSIHHDFEGLSIAARLSGFLGGKSSKIKYLVHYHSDTIGKP